MKPVCCLLYTSGKIGIKIQLLLPPLLLGHQHALAQLFIQREGCFVGQDLSLIHI